VTPTINNGWNTTGTTGTLTGLNTTGINTGTLNTTGTTGTLTGLNTTPSIIPSNHPTCTGILPINAILVQGGWLNSNPWINDNSNIGPYMFCTFRCPTNYFYRNDSYGKRCLMYPTS
jgi:hypothetical protein